MPRQFIDETIELLTSSAQKIENSWNLFKEGKINKEKFEEDYEQILFRVWEDVEDERYGPNNGCKYSETNPEVDYFKTQKI